LKEHFKKFTKSVPKEGYPAIQTFSFSACVPKDWEKRTFGVRGGQGRGVRRELTQSTCSVLGLVGT
jgi:hypothetical protein